MPITQILLTAGAGGQGPTAYANYGATPTEGGSTEITLYVQNWDARLIYWEVVGKGEPAADPATDMSGTLSGTWDPGDTNFASQVVTTINFTTGSVEGTEYWGVKLGTSAGASDIWSNETWEITEPLFYNSWTIEWFQKSNSTQPSQFPRVFGIATYPSQSIGFSLEGTYYGWIAGSGLVTSASVAHNTWQHWAMVSDGSTFSMYRNGSRVATTGRSSLGRILNTQNDFYVGIDSSPTNGYKGLLTNFRVVKGQAMYDPTQSTITTPVVPLVSNSNTELLLKAVDALGLDADSSSRSRLAVGTSGIEFSADTPFTAAGPYTQYTNIGANSGVLDFSGSNYNADILNNVKIGWTVTDGTNTGTVTSNPFETDPGYIRMGISFSGNNTGTYTFTQPALGGSIEFYPSSNYGMIRYNYGPEWALDIPSPTYTITPAANNINEGSSLEFTVSGSGIPDGTYYWTINTTGGPFDALNGPFTITDNVGSITVTPTADAFTDGSATFTLSIRTFDISGPIQATSELITINDTSLTPVQLESGTALSFDGSSQYVVVSGNQTDWALGDTWTIEWWEAIPDVAESDGFRGVMSQDSNQAPYVGIDVFHANGSIQMFNSAWNFTEPARGQWNHIAIQKNGSTASAYVNGVSTSISANTDFGTLSTNNLNLAIGIRTADGGANNTYGQNFYGQIANIRISNVVRYSNTFTPPTTVVVDANTVLSLDGSSGGDGMLIDETARHAITNNGATEDPVI
jgi:hypothetical protein